jgi:hypothetical protein
VGTLGRLQRAATARVRVVLRPGAEKSLGYSNPVFMGLRPTRLIKIDCFSFSLAGGAIQLMPDASKY